MSCSERGHVCIQTHTHTSNHIDKHKPLGDLRGLHFSHNEELWTINYKLENVCLRADFARLLRKRSAEISGFPSQE
jgi:hypothetical protein